MCTTDDDEIDFSSIKKNVQVVHERRKRVIQNIFAQKERSPSSSSRVGVCVLDFFFLFFFFVLSPKLSNTFCVSFFVCVLLLGIIIKLLCVHSLRGPTPVVVVLFLVFFSSVLFLHFALFCAFYVYIRRRREDRFQSKIRHLARSQSHN